MTELLLYTVFLLLAYGAVIKLWWLMMQPKGLLDVVSSGRWSNMLDNLYAKDNKIELILGGCEKCTAFWWGLPYTIACVVFMYKTNILHIGIIASYIWFSIFWFLCGAIGLWALTFRKK